MLTCHAGISITMLSCVTGDQQADMLTCSAGNKVAAKPGAGEFFLMSALAKLGATILTYPVLLVKSRLQAASKHTHADLQYSGTYDALKRIWQKEGRLYEFA